MCLGTRSCDSAFSPDELAVEANVTTGRIVELVELQLLSPGDGAFTPSDVGRLAVIEALVAGGIPIGDLAEAAKKGKVSLAWFEGVLPPPASLGDRTFRELLDEVDLPDHLVIHLFELWGVAKPELDRRVREDDETLLRLLAAAFSAFARDERLLIDGTRYFGDNARRNAESQIAFLRRGVIEPLLAAGHSLKEVVNPLTASIIRPGVQSLILWLNRRHVDAQNMQMLVQMVETALQEAGVEVPTVERPPTIAFLDLSGFTRLTDEAGDEHSADLATQLSELVRSAAARYDGSVVKFLGDGVMFHFRVPTDGVLCALTLVQEATERNLPRARVGLHAGPVVFRDGDYFGRTVNVAARIADYARPGEVLLSDSIAAN